MLRSRPTIPLLALGVCALLVLAGAAGAQAAHDATLTASAGPLGAGFSAGGLAPQLTSTRPVIAKPVTLLLSCGAPKATGWLFLGVPDPKPTDLGGGAVLYVDPVGAVLVAEFPVDANGAWLWSSRLDVDPALAGAQVVLQAVIAASGAVADGDTFDLTNGLLWTLGF